MEFLTSHIMELMWSSIVGLLLYISTSIRKNFREVINDNKNMKDGVKAVLHDRIIQKCTYIITDQGYVTTDDLEELEELNIPYKALGGNGTVKVAIQNVKNLRMK